MSLPFDRLPQVNPAEPHLAKRFKAMMARRPSVERAIKRLKCDLADRRLSQRTNKTTAATAAARVTIIINGPRKNPPGQSHMCDPYP